MLKTRVMLILRVFVSLSILIYISWVTRTNQAQIYSALKTMTSLDVLIAFLLLLFTLLLQIWRWRVVTESLSDVVERSDLINIFLAASFCGLVLPSSMVGDAIRITALLKGGVSGRVAITSVFLDRVSGLMALLMILVVSHSLFYAWGYHNPVIVSGLLISIFALSFIFLTLFDFPFETLSRKWQIGRLFFDLRCDFRRILLSKNPGIVIFLVSILIQMVSSISIYFIAKSLNIEVALWHCIGLMPIVMLATIIPISIAGWGVREAVIVVVFGIIAMPAYHAVLMSMIFGLLMTAMYLMCGFFWFFSPKWDFLLKFPVRSK